MKVRVIKYSDDKNKIYEAKRLKDLTESEINHSVGLSPLWDPNDIFVKMREDSDCLTYKHASELEIIEEDDSK